MFARYTRVFPYTAPRCAAFAHCCPTVSLRVTRHDVDSNRSQVLTTLARYLPPAPMADATDYIELRMRLATPQNRWSLVDTGGKTMKSKTNLDKYHGLSLTIVMSAVTIPIGHAQQVCSEDDVQTVLQELTCVADGTYISPTSLVADIQDDCSDELTQEECYQCYRRELRKAVKPFKALMRAGRLPRSFIDGLRTSTFDAADATCALLEDPSGFQDPELPDQSQADNNRGLAPDPHSDQHGQPRGPRERQRGGERRHD